MYPLNPIITDAFESSDILAVECDSTSVFQRPDYLRLMEKLMYTDGTDIRDHIPEDLYEKTDASLGKKAFQSVSSHFINLLSLPRTSPASCWKNGGILQIKALMFIS